MCQACVDECRMTQAELDERTAAGDLTVRPMIELTPEEFEEANLQTFFRDIDAGESPAVAAYASAIVAAEYQQIRAGLN